MIAFILTMLFTFLSGRLTNEQPDPVVIPLEDPNASIYDYYIAAADGTMVPMSDFKGKVILVVNTATKCGFTPQYEELQALWDKYHDKGLVILDFPCNQFGSQAPGSIVEIKEFCQSHYATKFDQMAKVDVNGADEIPLYTFLKSKLPFKGFTGSKAKIMDRVAKMNDKDYKNNPNIKWNFTKFLVDREGNPVRRFEPTDEMSAVEAAIEALL